MYQNRMIKLVAAFCLLALFGLTNADIQAKKLYELLKIKRSRSSPVSDTWSVNIDKATDEYSPVYIAPQDGLAELDKIETLPGQPAGVDFNQYSGYVTVNPTAGRALFYYFVESPTDSSSKPLVLWQNGGPGYSSMNGAMSEVGPFRITSDGKSLFRNDYAWSNVANMLFLESPAGVGFSYSNTTSDYDHAGDKNTADDAYIFLVNWLERFPQYKTRDFYIAGEAYGAGHYVPQLSYTILLNNKITNQTVINIKGIALGNPWIDDEANQKGMYDYWWTHAINSDATHAAILKYCDFANETSSEMCHNSTGKAWYEMGNIDESNIYEPICLNPDLRNASGTGSIDVFDPCWTYMLETYLNDSAVQKAFHVKPTSWHSLSDVIRRWNDSAVTILPIIKYLIENGQRLWIFSGDTDAFVPTTASRYSINTLNLPIETAWRPWYLNKEVGGYLEAYKGLLLITVRGAGNSVPSYQPQRALTMFSSFLGGILPPSS